MSQSVGDRNDDTRREGDEQRRASDAQQREGLAAGPLSGGPEVEPLVVTPNVFTTYQPPAIIGMKADSMDDNVDTFAANSAIPFGVVVGRTGAGLKTIGAGGSAVVGIAIHDHTVGSRQTYTQYDAVSVLTRGRVWARVSSGDQAACADGVVCNYRTADGTVTPSAVAAGIVALPHAVFRSAAVQLPDTEQVVWGTGVLTWAAVVEMHYPLAAQNE